jgi:protein involved in polysaccharide export with SLBB domain
VTIRTKPTGWSKMMGDSVRIDSGNMRFLLVTAALVAALGVLGGCGSSAEPNVRTEVVPFTPEQQQQMARAQTAEYRLRVGDEVGLDFKYEDALDSQRIMVLPDGRITLPGGVDPVMARGHSVVELDSMLTAAYAKDYRNPDLSVMIESLADLRVYVMGYVKRPGEVELPPQGMNVVQAIAAAGGFDEDAATSETVLMRVTEEGFLLRQIDLGHLEHRGIPDFQALDLQPYDVLFVPRSPIGDFGYFADTFIGGMLNVTDLFWDVYAIANIDKVETIWRR